MNDGKILRTRYAFAPLFNLRSNLREISLGCGKCIIHRANASEKKLAQKVMVGLGYDLQSFDWRFTVECTPSGEGGEEADIGECWSILQSCISALRLFKSGVVWLGPNFCMQVSPPRCVRYSRDRDAMEPLIEGNEYHLTEGEIADLGALYDQLCNLDLRKNRRLQTALFRLNLTHRAPLAYKPVDLMIGLEALYTGDSQELAYKLATRAAYVLGDTEARRARIWAVLKAAYNVRSDIVHGKRLPNTIKLGKGQPIDALGMVLEVEDILRMSTKRFMTLVCTYSHDELIREILDKNVLSGGKLLAPKDGEER